MDLSARQVPVKNCLEMLSLELESVKSSYNDAVLNAARDEVSARVIVATPCQGRRCFSPRLEVTGWQGLKMTENWRFSLLHFGRI